MANRGSVVVVKAASDAEKEEFLNEKGGVAAPSQDFVLVRGGFEYVFTGEWTYAKSYDKDKKPTGRKFLVLMLRCVQTNEIVSWYPTSVRKTLPALIGVLCPGSFAAELRDFLNTDAVINGAWFSVEFAKDAVLPVGCERADGTIVSEEDVKVTADKETVKVYKSGNRILLEWLQEKLKDSKKMRAQTIIHRHVVVVNGQKTLSEHPKQLVGWALDGADDYNAEGEEDMSDSI